MREPQCCGFQIVGFTLWVPDCGFHIVGVRLQEIKRSGEIIGRFHGIQISISGNANPTFDIKFLKKHGVARLRDLSDIFPRISMTIWI